MRAGVRKGGMRVAPVARLSQLGCLCLTTWIVVTILGDHAGPRRWRRPGGSGEINETHAPPSNHTPCHRVSHLHYT